MDRSRAAPQPCIRSVIEIESILRSTISVKAVERTQFRPYDVVIPEVSSSAFISGRSEYYFDFDDPFRRGFIFRGVRVMSDHPALISGQGIETQVRTSVRCVR